MKFLLDTHIAIWAVLDSEELLDKTRVMLLDACTGKIRKNEVHDTLIPYYNESFIISV